MSEDILEQIEQESSNDKQKRHAEIKARIKAFTEHAAQKRYDFPIHVFPKQLREILETYNRCYGLPIDYFGLGALTAASGIIGNAYSVRYRFGQEYPCIMYSAIVGNSSIGKTPAIKLTLGPIFELEKEYLSEYREQLEHWKKECFDRAQAGARGQDPPKPTQSEILINDATIESINVSLSHNPRGLLYFRDELSGWINSLNQYRKGSDVEFWLSNWSNASSKVSRVSKEPIFLKKPFISVIGGIQPAILESLAGDGRQENGFLARVLFAYPQEMIKPYESDLKPDISIFQRYQRILFYLRDLPTKIEPPGREFEEWTVDSIFLKLDEGAQVAYGEFHKANTDQINESHDDTMKSILGKMESYCLRFALILQLLEVSCDLYGEEIPLDLEEAEKISITEKNITRAVELVNYFKATATYVLTRFESPVNKLPVKQQGFYATLPEEFETKEALEISEELKISERTVKRFLNDKTLFKKIRRGVYEKLYL